MVVYTVMTLVPSQDEANTYIIPIINDNLYIQTGILLCIERELHTFVIVHRTNWAGFLEYNKVR